MASSVRRLISLSVVLVAIGLAVPLAASAATIRYASPDGTGASPCIQAAPCPINRAVSFAEGLRNGDTVLLAPGTYHPTSSVEVFQSVTISGEAGKPAPLIEATGNSGLFLQEGSFAHDIRIHSPPGTFAGLTAEFGTVVERIESTGEAAAGCALGEVTVRDSVCAAPEAGGTGIFSGLGAGSPITQHLKLINVTAIGGSYGIVAQGTVQAVVSIDATNAISVGGEFDVEARTTGTASSQIVLTHSNFATTNLSGSSTSISSPAANGNQTAAPLFVDEAGGDYREQATSPTRLAGDLGVVLPGELDLAGNPRATNCAGTVGVDIGAYQYECPTPETPVVPPQEEKKGGPPPTGSAQPPQPAPVLSKLALKPAKFTTTGKAPKGTTISYTLSAPATVKIEVLGAKTVKGKKKTVTLGSLPHAPGKAGRNSVKFSGKVKGKPLEPGEYTLRVIAGGPGGSAKPVKKTFTVLAVTG
jgi:hypothetical protein